MIHACVRFVQELHQLPVHHRDPALGNCPELAPDDTNPFLHIRRDIQGGVLMDDVRHKTVRSRSEEEKAVVQISRCRLAEGVEENCCVGAERRRTCKHDENT